MAGDTDGFARFARDFGYLEKFLQAITAHAANAPGPAGERLRELLEGEGERWSEVRAVLEGRGPTAAGRSGARPPAAAPAAASGGVSDGGPARAASGARPTDGVAGNGLTVGSLLGDRRQRDP